MAKTTNEKDDTDDEGPRGFGVILSQIGDGELHEDLSARLQLLVTDCRAYAERYERKGKGTLTLVLSVSALDNGAIEVSGDIKAKHPQAKSAGSIFWPTKGNNLTLDHPRQQKLPLKEVSFERPKTKDISPEDRPVRGV